MIRRPPRSTRTDTLFPYTTLFRSATGVPRGALSTAQSSIIRLLNPDSAKVGTSGRSGLRLVPVVAKTRIRSEEHTSELQSLMRISYAVFCLKKKTNLSHYNTFAHHSSTVCCLKYAIRLY